MSEVTKVIKERKPIDKTVLGIYLNKLELHLLDKFELSVYKRIKDNYTKWGKNAFTEWEHKHILSVVDKAYFI